MLGENINFNKNYIEHMQKARKEIFYVTYIEDDKINNNKNLLNFLYNDTNR